MGFIQRLFGKAEPPRPPAPTAPGLVRIVCSTSFLDGATRYEAGDARAVPADRAAYFVAHGWASLADTALSVQDGTIGTGDSNG